MPLALNIQTFIHLVGYGYPNIRELDEIIDIDDPHIPWVGTVRRRRSVPLRPRGRARQAPAPASRE